MRLLGDGRVPAPGWSNGSALPSTGFHRENAIYVRRSTVMILVKRILRKHGYLPDKREKARRPCRAGGATGGRCVVKIAGLKFD